MLPVRSQDRATFDPDVLGSISSLFGFAFLSAWVFVHAFPPLFPPANSEAVAFLVTIDLLYPTVWTVGVLLLGLFARRLGTLHEKPVLLFGAPLLMGLGTLMIILAGWGDQVSRVWLIIGNVAAPLGSAGLIILWGEIYASLDLKRACVNAAGANVLGVLICFLIANLRPTAAVVMIVLLPVFSGALVWLGAQRSYTRTSPSSAKSLQPHFFGKFLAVFFAISLVMGLAQQFTPALAATDAGYQLLASAAGALLLVLLATWYPRGLDFSLVYRAVLPLLLVGVLVMSIPGLGYQAFATAAISVSLVCVRILTWVMLSDLPSRLRMPAAGVFGRGEALTTVGQMLGFYIGLGVGGSSLLESLVIVGAVVVILVISLFLLGGEHDILAIFGRLSKGAPVLTGSAAMQQESSAAIAAKYHLSPREQEVLLLLLQGQGNGEIQKELYIASGTLRVHLRNIYAKTGVHSRQELLSLPASYSDNNEADTFSTSN